MKNFIVCFRVSYVEKNSQRVQCIKNILVILVTKERQKGIFGLMNQKDRENIRLTQKRN